MSYELRYYNYRTVKQKTFNIDSTSMSIILGSALASLNKLKVKSEDEMKAIHLLHSIINSNHALHAIRVRNGKIETID